MTTEQRDSNQPIVLLFVGRDRELMENLVEQIHGIYT